MNGSSGDWGNRYLLLVGCVPPDRPVVIAPGVSLSPVDASVANLFSPIEQESMRVRPLLDEGLCEIESAQDSVVAPSLSATERALLASKLLVMLGYSRHFKVALADSSWAMAAREIKRDHERMVRYFQENPDAETYESASPSLTPIRLWQEVPTVHERHSRAGPLGATDLRWTNDNFGEFNRLCVEEQSFDFALEAAVDWRYSVDSRTALARLWSGIEAITLRRAKSEITFQLAARVAALLEERGPRRRDMFRSVKKLYDTRSRIVHGDEVEAGKVQDPLEESFRLLCSLLKSVVALGKVPDADDFEKWLFE